MKVSRGGRHCDERTHATLRMIFLLRSKKRFTAGNHGKPLPMKRARKFFVILGPLIFAGGLSAQAPATSAVKPQVWVASWGTSQQIPEPQNALPPDDLR